MPHAIAVHPAVLVKPAKSVMLRFAINMQRIKSVLEPSPKMGRAPTLAFGKRAFSPEWVASIRGHSLVSACDQVLSDFDGSHGDLGFSDSEADGHWLCIRCGARASDAYLKSGKAFARECVATKVPINFNIARDRLVSLPLGFQLYCNGAVSHRSHKLAILNGLPFCLSCGLLGNQYLKGLLSKCCRIPANTPQSLSYGARNLRALHANRLPQKL